MACILPRLIFVDIVILANFHASLTCTIDETNELDTTEDPIVIPYIRSLTPHREVCGGAREVVDR